jgi:hypothetical protein
MVMVAPGAARAQALTWHVTHVANDAAGAGESPAGVAMRQWGPSGDVFLLWHGALPFGPRAAARLGHFSCDAAPPGGHWCETVTELAREQMGNLSYGQHLLHPAMAIRSLPSSNHLELLLTHTEYDYGGASCAPVGSSERWDLVSHLWNTDVGTTRTQAVEAAWVAGLCSDYGVTEVKFDQQGVGRACYTNPDPVSDETVHCNEQGTGAEWGYVEQLDPIDPSMDEADHPSFVMHGGRPTVVHHEGTSAEDWISFRPGRSGASDFVFDDASVAAFRKDHPVVIETQDELRVVYQFGDGTNAHIMYKWCDDLTGDCDDYSPDPTNSNNDDWHEEIVTDSHDDAAHAEVMVDWGEQREFVAFTYDSNHPYQHRRVVLATRCIGQDNPWTFHEPRQPPVTRYDQALNYGRPSMVLDRVNDVVHIAFAEAEEWHGNSPSYSMGQGGELYWVRASYADAVIGDCN